MAPPAAPIESGKIILTPRMQWVINQVEQLEVNTVIELAGFQGMAHVSSLLSQRSAADAV